MKQKIITEYLRRSYFAVDGLWFMMIEKDSSFDKALEIDANVWRILPKIQARKVKELLGLKGSGLDDLMQAIKVKFEAEEYDYEEIKQDSSHVQITICKCPWYEILKKANREHLALQIADSICTLDFRVWTQEFGENLKFRIDTRCCAGDSVCVLDFSSG